MGREIANKASGKIRKELNSESPGGDSIAMAMTLMERSPSRLAAFILIKGGNSGAKLEANFGAKNAIESPLRPCARARLSVINVES